MNNQYEEIKEQLVKTAKKAYREKLMAGTSGNMSIFCKEQGHIIITPSGYDYEIMERKDAVVIDLDGNLIEGIHKPSSEWRMHAEIYRQLPKWEPLSIPIRLMQPVLRSCIKRFR